MTTYAGIVRDPVGIAESIPSARQLVESARRELGVSSAEEVGSAFRVIDLCVTHVVYLEAFREYLEHGGGSRGSGLVLDQSGPRIHDTFEESWGLRPADPASEASARILEVELEEDGSVQAHWTSPRPVPEPEVWFEQVWRDYRLDHVIG
jgi:hypothetical protein